MDGELAGFGATGAVTQQRRYDLDVLRIGAFFLLIFYHVGMFYVPGGWHAKSTYILPQLETPMGLPNPWRLTLLFFISGAATRFMSDKLAVRSLFAQRSTRLLIPLLFGVLLIVPPQSWVEVVEQHGYTGNFFDFWINHYLAFDQGFHIILPAYNHLWFVAYLWLYTALAVLLWRFMPALDRLAARWLTGAGLLIVPIALLGVYRAVLFPHWPESHIIWWDFYNHAHYATAFVLGLLLARQDAVWATLTKWRIALLISIPIIVAIALPLSDIWEEKTGWRGEVFAFIREGYAWIVICTLLGYAHRYIRGGSPLLTMLSEAVFPFYIIHQTATVLIGHFISPLQLPLATEAAIVIGGTALSCVMAYGLARAVPVLRLPFGLKPQ